MRDRLRNTAADVELLQKSVPEPERASSAHCVMRMAAWWNTRSMPCMASARSFAIADIAVHDSDAPAGQGVGQILAAPTLLGATLSMPRCSAPKLCANATFGTGDGAASTKTKARLQKNTQR